MQLVRRPRHRNSQPATTLHRSRSDNAADHVIMGGANDAPIGMPPKLEAHRRGVRHQAISVVVGDQHRRLLLHKCAAGKYHPAGLWANTCCSHPRLGEITIKAAARRLTEEMGVICPFTPIFSMSYRADVSNGLIANEIVRVFGGRFQGTPDPDPFEASAWCKTAVEIEQDIDEQPENHTIWFQKFCRDFWSGIVRISEPNILKSADFPHRPLTTIASRDYKPPSFDKRG